MCEDPQPATVPQVFAAQAKRQPHAVAVRYGADIRSYGALQHQSSVLAQHLRRLGVSLESRVGVFLEPGCDMVVALLAILRAGGTYVPLDPSYPQQRLSFMLEDSAPVVVISQASLAGNLPATAAEVVLLAGPAGQEPRRLPRASEVLCRGQGADNLAYIIYTSGSTGRPKGVSIPHRGILRLVLATNYISLGPEDRVAQVANTSFDAVTLEIWGPLLNGGCIVGIAPTIALEPSLFATELRHGRISAMFLTSALFNQIARQCPNAFAQMECLMVGGEALDPRWIRHVLAHRAPRRLLNGYGPTENTTFTAVFEIEEVAADATGIAIGYPISGSTTHVVDSSLRPQPDGRPGELLTGGEGLARGYEGRPRTTALRFIPDPFAGQAGGRLYRTGDLVERRADGALEFQGRLDHQIKLRGFRIELGEIEAALGSHPRVAASTVLLQATTAAAQGSEERQLVAYVVPRAAAVEPDPQPEGAGGAGQVAQWQMIFEDLYAGEDRAAEPQDPTFDTTGWLSTYSGEAIPAAQMREWLAETISQIRRLQPRRVLEIGCGTGMLLFRIAPETEFYLGTDISPRVLAGVEAELARRGSLPQVRLAERSADQFDDVEPASLDTVLLNSVVQYFPSADYLATVLRRAARVVRPGGAIFVGDVRSLPLLDVFHTAVEISQAPPDLAVEELRRRIAGRLQRENELVVDPAFFTALAEQVPEIGQVEIVPKRGRAKNELTEFRYQVVLRIGPTETPVASFPRHDWQATGMSLAALRQHLKDSTAPWLGWRQVPNLRVVREVAAARLLSQSAASTTIRELRRSVSGAEEGAVEPQDLWDLAEEFPFDVAVGQMNDEEGSLQVVFQRRVFRAENAGPGWPHAALAAARPSGRARRGAGSWDLSKLTNQPAKAPLDKPRTRDVRAFLAGKLPPYMVPASFVFVEALPLTPNGKVDRRALERLALAPAQDHMAPTDLPRTPMQDLLATLWAQVLGLDRVGIHDDFFALGGHSLKAVQVVSRLRDSLGLGVTIRQVMEASTVAELAQVVEGVERHQEGLAEIPPLLPSPGGTAEVPASFAQRRLWFLHRWLPGNLAYNVPLLLHFRGPLSPPLLEAALAEINRRHGALRTTFREAEQGPLQVEGPPSWQPLPCVDLRALGDAGRPVAEKLCAAVGLQPYDLSVGPLWRRLLVRLAGEEALLLVAFHHIVFDGWSMGLFFRELAALYDAAKEGQPSPLPTPAVQPADFALWQHSWLEGKLLAKELAWWKERLAGAPTVLDLPTDRPRQALRGMRFPGRIDHFQLPRTLGGALEEVGRHRGATLFMVLLAAFQLLLARLSGQQDLLVGSPVANRSRREIEDLIGFFVNTLALRARLAEAPTFGLLIDQARHETLAASAHQDLPFETLVQSLEPERTPGVAPLVQVMMVLQTAAMEVVSPAGLHLEAHLLPTGAARFDFGLELTWGEEGLAAAAEYNTDLFDSTTVERFMACFQLALEAVVQDPDLSLADLSLLSAAQRHQVLVEWNADSASAPPLSTVAELFAQQARKTPEAVAVLSGDCGLSYGELFRRVQHLAAHLVEEGVGPERVVGICLERTPELVVAMLAVFEAGGAVLALDPALPPERLAFLLRDAQVEMVLRRRGIGPKTLEARSLELDALWKVAAPAPRIPRPKPAAHHLAYLIYTSGTTGRPKAVQVEHRQLSHTLWASRRMLASGGEGAGWRPGDVQPVVAPFSFDIFFFELLNPLLAGATAHLVPAQPTVDLRTLTSILERATGFHAVPTLMQALVESVETSRRGGFPGVRAVFVGGEAVPAEVLRGLRRIFPQAAVRVLYGPTEATIICSAYDASGEGAEQARPFLGRPLAGVELRICDASGGLVPLGVAGELWIGGPGVSRGYLHQPGLEEEKFPTVEGRRFYRSGDRVRATALGNIEFLGREDRQVKVRGFRIELGEIEEVLARHPGVRQAAVVVGRESGPERLVAFFVPTAAGTVPDLEGMEHFLRRRLPEYMVPSELTLRSEFPQLPTGKLDRRQLEREAAEPRAGGGDGGAPRTPMEELLAAMWCELLDLPRVGVKESFFRLGGHSLLATRWVARVRNALGIEVSLSDLFENPTLEALAQRVEVLQNLDGTFATPPLVPRHDLGEPAPASFAQERLWFLDQWQPQSAVYNVPVVLRLRGALSQPALARSLAEIELRHEVLRTVFEAQEEGPPLQRVLPPAFAGWEGGLPVVDLSALPDPDAEAQHLVEWAARRPFDLATGPLWWALLLRSTATEHRLFLGFHHIALDGASMEVLIHELTVLYQACSQGLPSPLPELTVRYGDFSVWQRGWLCGARLDQEIAFWRDHLAGAPSLLELPTDRPRPTAQGDRGSNLPVTLGESLVAGMEQLARERGVTLFMVLLAGFTTLMARLSSQRDLVIGMPIANRTHRELEALLGFFVNTLALRFDLTGRPSFEQLLVQAREVALASYRHQDVPFEKVVEELRPDRQLNHTPFVQVVLGLEPGAAKSGRLGEATVSREFVRRSVSKVDVSLVLEKTAAGMCGEVEFSVELFDATTLKRWLKHLEILLAAASADPQCPVDALPWLDPAQTGQLVVEWNDTARQRAPWVAVHELFARQAVLRPEAIAVEQGTLQLSYRELRRQAGALAAELGGRGLCREARVALSIHRSPQLVIAMLAVLEAGGTYLPLDPDHPQERRQALLQESRAAWLLTAAGAGVPRQEGAGAAVVGEISCRALLVEGPSVTDRGSDVVDGVVVPPAISPERLAYVLYTSGSSGRPKGVMMSHGALSNFLHWMLESFELAPGDSYLARTPAVFDPSVKEYFLPLMSGGRILLVEEGGQTDFAHLAKVAVEGRARHQQMVPSQAQLWLQEPGLRGSSLRQFFCGGEALPTELADRLRGSTLGGIDLYNFYGPTETCVLVTWAKFVAGVHDDPWSSLAIGRPIGNTQAHVLDAEFRPVPVGVPGELVIAGGSLARGYLGAARQTAEAFLPDPFAATPGARLYRTGDVVHSLQDGRLIFQQRKDFQIKLHGLRIEPAEIEAVLLAHPAVRSAVVTSQEQRLVAWLIAAREEPPAPLALREFLARSLPAHMVPVHFTWLDSLPTTASGKVDRAALQRRALPEVADETADNAPRSATEEILQGIWCEVLGREEVGRGQSFFDLGGHSLVATRVTSRASTLFGVELGPRQLFEHPTVAALAAEIERLRSVGQDAAKTAEPIRPVSRREPLVLSFAQERLWFLDQLSPGDLTYNSTAPLGLEGSLDVGALRGAFEQLVRRHEILRTTFVRHGDQPVQRIAPAGPHPLPLVDLQHLDEACRRAQVERLTFEEEQRPYDLAQGPLFRTLLLRLADDQHALLMSCHHIVFDGWSMGILIDEAIAFYEQNVGAIVATGLRPLTVQYADYAAWQRRTLAGEALEEELSWWRQALASDQPAIPLPTDVPRSQAGPSRAQRQSFRLSAATSAGLRRLARQENSTLFMTLLAAFKTLLHRLTGADSVALGTPIANRHHLEIEGLIGFFVNTLVIRTDFSGRPSFHTVLCRVGHAALGAYDHQDLPYEKLVADFGSSRPGGAQPLFQTLFTLGDPQPPPRQVRGLLFRPLPAASQGRRGTAFDLSLGLADTSGELLVGSLEYDAALFKTATIDTLLERFQTLLDHIVRSPHRSVADLEILSPKEEQQLHAAAAQALEVDSGRRRDAATVEEGEVAAVLSEERLRGQVSARKEGLSAAKQALLARRLKGRKKSTTAQRTAAQRDTMAQRTEPSPAHPSSAQESPHEQNPSDPVLRPKK